MKLADITKRERNYFSVMERFMATTGVLHIAGGVEKSEQVGENTFRRPKGEANGDRISPGIRSEINSV